MTPAPHESAANPALERPLIVTSALPYANGPIHFGHVTGAYLPADVYARFQRLVGRDVIYICGTDEHGVSITVNAEREGTSYPDYVARWHREIKALFDRFEIRFDHFGRTSTDAEHHPLSQEFFLRLLRAGAVLPRATQQHYCTTCERFLPDRYVEGTCYLCGRPAARGDECKACGAWLEAIKIVEPHCVTCGQPPEVRDTMQYELALGHFFDAAPSSDPAGFPGAAFVEWRAAFGREREADFLVDGRPVEPLSPVGLKSNVRAAVFEKLQHEGDGLRGRPITRDLRWGVPLPAVDLDGQPVEGHEGKVLYVWFDAPIGYVSATIEWARTAHPDDPAAAEAAWRRFWITDAALPGHAPAGAQLVHFIGKDNIPFHAVVFPAMLAWQSPARPGERFLGPVAGQRWVLPANVPANEFYNLEGRKFSTSDRWTLDTAAMFERFGTDALRWYLVVSMPETADSQFRFDGLADHVNAELNDTLGNYASRVLKFVHKYMDGVVPEPWPGFALERDGRGTPTAAGAPGAAREAGARVDAALREARELLELRRPPHRAADDERAPGEPALGDLLERFEFRRAAQALMEFCRRANHRYDADAPWQSRKADDLTDCRADLFGHVQRLAALGVALWPFMPGASDRLRAMLGLTALDDLLAERGGAERGPGRKPSLWRFEPVAPGHALGEPGSLFRKVDREALEADKARLLPGLGEAAG